MYIAFQPACKQIYCDLQDFKCFEYSYQFEIAKRVSSSGHNIILLFGCNFLAYC